MKKLILIIALTVGMITVASAQLNTRSIGARLGYNLEATYQHPMGDMNRLEVTAGLASFKYVTATASYQWIFELPSNFGWYAGIGATTWLTGGFNIGAMGVIGIQYDLEPVTNLPLSLSIDYRPGYYFLNDGGRSLNDTALSIRYKF